MAKMGWHYTPCNEGGSGSEIPAWVVIVAAAAVAVCIGGATRVSELDAAIRETVYIVLGVVGTIALTVVLVAAYLVRRWFWARWHARPAPAAAVAAPRTQPVHLAAAGPRALSQPAPAFDVAYHMSGEPAETVKVVRLAREDQP